MTERVRQAIRRSVSTRQDPSGLTRVQVTISPGTQPLEAVVFDAAAAAAFVAALEENMSRLVESLNESSVGGRTVH